LICLFLSPEKYKDVESSMQIWDVQAWIWDPDMAERSDTCPVNDLGNFGMKSKSKESVDWQV
jgi:hypothetical protein